jgi:hypothetical protein
MVNMEILKLQEILEQQEAVVAMEVMDLNLQRQVRMGQAEPMVLRDLMGLGEPADLAAVVEEDLAEKAGLPDKEVTVVQVELVLLVEKVM